MVRLCEPMRACRGRRWWCHWRLQWRERQRGVCAGARVAKARGQPVTPHRGPSQPLLWALWGVNPGSACCVAWPTCSMLACAGKAGLLLQERVGAAARVLQNGG